MPINLRTFFSYITPYYIDIKNRMLKFMRNRMVNPRTFVNNQSNFVRQVSLTQHFLEIIAIEIFPTLRNNVQ